MLNKWSEVYKPFTYNWAEDIRKQHEDIHWIPEEADLTQDVEQWKTTLDNTKKQFIKAILSMFTQSDVAVGRFYVDYLLPRIKNNEIRNMLMSFAAREAIHQEGYALLNDTLGLGDAFWSDFMSHPETLDKWEYIKREQNKDNLGLALAQQTFMEGISLFGSFVMLKNFERHGELLGTCKINEWSLKDETLHVEGNAHLFREWTKENPLEVNGPFKLAIYEMVREIVKLEDDFIDMVFSDFDIEDLDKEDVKLYVKYIANRRLVQLGLKENWEGIDTNPLPWMDMLSNGSSLQNFFEGRVTDYSVSGLSGVFKY
jgi:ribonucleotide reductase beta subunit family protein with ferritin-like domain